MQADPIQQKIQTVFRDVLGIESLEIRSEMTSDDFIEWDSMAHIRLIIEIEKTFNVNITTAEIAQFDNVGQLISLIQNKLK